VVQLPRRGDVRVFGDGVAIEGLAVRGAGAADGAFEGSGVDFCVPPIFPQLVGDLCREIGREVSLWSHGRRKVLPQQRRAWESDIGIGEIEVGGAYVDAGVIADEDVTGLFIDVFWLVETNPGVEEWDEGERGNW
jgi:hypothetical protein